MKYILNENIKHILDERYILTEATLESVADKWVIKIKNSLSPLKEKIQKINDIASADADTEKLSNLISEVNKAEKDVNNSKRIPDGDEELKNDLNTYYIKVNDLLEFLKTKFSRSFAPEKLDKIEEDLATLRTKISTSAWNDEDKKEALKIFNETFTAISTTWGEDKLKLPQSTKTLIALCTETIKRIDLLTTKYLPTTWEGAEEAELSEFVETLSTKLWPAIDNVTKLTVKDTPTDTDIENYNIILSSLSEAIAEVANAKIRTQIDDAIDRNQNWTGRYETCVTADAIKAFWNGDESKEGIEKAGYLKTVFGSAAEFARNLGDTLKEDIVEYGFTKAENPLITFILMAAENGFKISKEAYIALHNAIVSNWLSLKDFAGRGKFRQYNIIFRRTLYNLVSTNILKLLEIQHIIETRSSDLAEPYSEVATKSPAEFLNNIMLNSGNLSELSNDKVLHSGLDSDFRSITAVNQVVRKLYKLENKSDEKSPLTSKDLEEMLNTVKDDATAKLVLSFLTEVWYSLKPTLLAKLDSQWGSKLSKNRQAGYPAFSDSQKIAETFRLAEKAYTNDQIKQVLTVLMEKSGYLPKKSSGEKVD